MMKVPGRDSLSVIVTANDDDVRSEYSPRRPTSAQSDFIPRGNFDFLPTKSQTATPGQQNARLNRRSMDSIPKNHLYIQDELMSVSLSMAEDAEETSPQQELERLTGKVSAQDDELQELRAQLRQANKEKSKLEARLGRATLEEPGVVASGVSQYDLIMSMKQSKEAFERKMTSDLDASYAHNAALNDAFQQAESARLDLAAQLGTMQMERRKDQNQVFVLQRQLDSALQQISFIENKSTAGRQESFNFIQFLRGQLHHSESTTQAARQEAGDLSHQTASMQAEIARMHALSEDESRKMEEAQAKVSELSRKEAEHRQSALSSEAKISALQKSMTDSQAKADLLVGARDDLIRHLNANNRRLFDMTREGEHKNSALKAETQQLRDDAEKLDGQISTLADWNRGLAQKLEEQEGILEDHKTQMASACEQKDVAEKSARKYRDEMHRQRNAISNQVRQKEEAQRELQTLKDEFRVDKDAMQAEIDSLRKQVSDRVRDNTALIGRFKAEISKLKDQLAQKSEHAKSMTNVSKGTLLDNHVLIEKYRQMEEYVRKAERQLANQRTEMMENLFKLVMSGKLSGVKGLLESTGDPVQKKADMGKLLLEFETALK